MLFLDSLTDIDPLFVVGDGLRSIAEDYRILATSPARDNGINRISVPDIDYWSALRDDGAIDTGAHEYSE